MSLLRPHSRMKLYAHRFFHVETLIFAPLLLGDPPENGQRGRFLATGADRFVVREVEIALARQQFRRRFFPKPGAFGAVRLPGPRGTLIEIEDRIDLGLPRGHGLGNSFTVSVE